jgi:6-phosphogluconolactonase
LAGTVGLAAACGLVALAGQAQAGGWQSTTGAVYTMTNSATGNAIEAYGRASDGTLTPAGTYPTGGAGGTLDSGHSIVVSGDGRVLVNVNAGSDSVSAFAVTPWGLHLIGTVSSGGTDPDSVTIAGDQLIYVLNAARSRSPASGSATRGCAQSRARPSHSALARWCRSRSSSAPTPGFWSSTRQAPTPSTPS